ncbi:MAG: GNAT family N-acetyltransferase [SAR324 cluster bacterium]|nr:GNAT family N-acetyltransferase [SAR324 cluster bacterium]
MYLDDFTISEGIKLELATLKDAKPIAILSRDLVEAGLGWSWTPSRIARHIRSPQSMVLVVRAQKQVIGFATMHFSQSEAHLDLLAVTPLYQRCGIGRHLVLFLERSAEVVGVSLIDLEVRINNQCARMFYRTLGYREIKVIPRYYQGREPAMRMTHHLKMSFSPDIGFREI